MKFIKDKILFNSNEVNFLAKLRGVVNTGKYAKERLTLSVYWDESLFESVVLMGVFKLDYCGVIMDTACYEIPADFDPKTLELNFDIITESKLKFNKDRESDWADDHDTYELILTKE